MRKCFGCGEVSGRMFYLILLRNGNTSLISSNHCYLLENCHCYCCADAFCWTLNKFFEGFYHSLHVCVFFTINSVNSVHRLTDADLTKYQSCVGCNNHEQLSQVRTGLFGFGFIFVLIQSIKSVNNILN